MKPSADFDATRRAIAERGLVATASGYLTSEVATRLPFEDLGAYKDLLKRFFSAAPWTAEDDAALDRLVAPHVDKASWEHDLGGGITLWHGVIDRRYRLRVDGVTETATSIFDRAFDGPVVPEPTPHPRKVRFGFAGTPAQGRWYRAGDGERVGDERARRILAEPDVTDVMVAGDFVTVGLSARASWEQRLEPLLALVTELFADDKGAVAEPERTRDELLREAGHASGFGGSAAELHLLDPNDPDHQQRLRAALADRDARIRRIAVALLAEADDPSVRDSALAAGYADGARTVRRTAVDAAADVEEESLRPFLETALTADDDWIRWRAVRALAAIGLDPSRRQVAALADDGEFRVRFEVERVLRGGGADR